MQQPIISIIIPTYNREDKITEPIKSIINQTYSNWELIIVDDKSTDNTKQVISEFSKKDKRIKYFLNTGNKGAAAARNFGIKQVSGKYIAFMDSDDKWISHHLMNSISVLEKYNKEVCFSLWYEIINGVKTPIDELDKIMFENGFEKFKHKTIDNVIVFNNKDFYEHLLLENFYCYHINTMVIKSSILTDELLFDENLKSNDDADFTFRIIMKYGFCLIKDYHYEYYYWDDSIYAFIDRRAFNFDKIKNNINTINRMTHLGIYKIIHYKKRKEFVKKSSLIKNKRDWINYYNNRIAKKLFTLGFLNKSISRRKGFYYYLKSLFYRFNTKTLKFIFKSSKYTPNFSNRKLNDAMFDFY